MLISLQIAAHLRLPHPPQILTEFLSFSFFRFTTFFFLEQIWSLCANPVTFPSVPTPHRTNFLTNAFWYSLSLCAFPGTAGLHLIKVDVSLDICRLDKLCICHLMSLVPVVWRLTKFVRKPFLWLCFLNSSSSYLFNEFIITPRRNTWLTYKKVNGFFFFFLRTIDMLSLTKSHAVLINCLNE